MRDSLDQLFTQNQFHRIKSNISAITLYAGYRSDTVSVIQLLDFENAYPITSEEYSLYKGKAIEFFSSKGYENIRFLTIISTPYVEECKKYIMDDPDLWILNSATKQLLVYENQVEDFCNIRSKIEELCIRNGGEKSVNPFQREESSRNNRSFVSREFTVVNTILVIINVGMFIYLTITGSTMDIDYMLEHGVMYVPRIMEDGEYYRFFSCIFLHFGFQHLIGNMVVLLFLGDNVERAMGWWKYMILYLGSGLTGSLGSFLYAYKMNQGIVSAGASGAIYGVIGALLWLVICNKGRLENMTLIRVIVMIAYALYSGFTSEHIDIAAHLCGLAGGFMLAVILYRKEKAINEDKHLLRRQGDS